MLQDKKEKTPLWIKIIEAILVLIGLFYVGSFASYLWTLEDFLLAQGY